MYRINLDVISKIIYVEISGSMSSAEIDAYVTELSNLVYKFDKRQYSMLFLCQRLDPFSQDNIQAIQKATELIIDWAKKAAVVCGNRIVTKMQLKRVETEARKNVTSSTPIMGFRFISEALNYLNSI